MKKEIWKISLFYSSSLFALLLLYLFTFAGFDCFGGFGLTIVESVLVWTTVFGTAFSKFVEIGETFTPFINCFSDLISFTIFVWEYRLSEKKEKKVRKE